MAGAKVLVDDEVWPALTRLAARKSRRSAIVAVPYVSQPLLDLRRGDTLAVDISPATLAAGLTNPAALRRYLKAGVELRSSPALHAKVFVLGDTAVIGSSNVSMSSMKALREAVVVLKDKADVQGAVEAVTRLLGAEITKAELDAASKLYRPPRKGPKLPSRPSKQHPAGEPPRASDRLWVIGLYEMDWPLTAERRASAAQRGIRRRAGSAAQVEIGSALFDVRDAPKLRVDDLVIEAWAPDKRSELETASFPARVIDLLPVAGRGRAAGWVIAYWRRPTGTSEVSWDTVRAAAVRAGARFGRDQTFMRHVRDPRLHRVLRQLWTRDGSTR